MWRSRKHVPNGHKAPMSRTANALQMSSSSGLIEPRSIVHPRFGEKNVEERCKARFSDPCGRHCLIACGLECRAGGAPASVGGRYGWRTEAKHGAVGSDIRRSRFQSRCGQASLNAVRREADDQSLQDGRHGPGEHDPPRRHIRRPCLQAGSRQTSSNAIYRRGQGQSCGTQRGHARYDAVGQAFPSRTETGCRASESLGHANGATRAIGEERAGIGRTQGHQDKSGKLARLALRPLTSTAD